MSIVHDAQEVLNNPAFKEAVQQYSKSLVTQWSYAASTAERENIWYQQKALTTVVNNLENILQSTVID